MVAEAVEAARNHAATVSAPTADAAPEFSADAGPPNPTPTNHTSASADLFAPPQHHPTPKNAFPTITSVGLFFCRLPAGLTCWRGGSRRKGRRRATSWPKLPPGPTKFVVPFPAGRRPPTCWRVAPRAGASAKARPCNSSIDKTAPAEPAQRLGGGRQGAGPTATRSLFADAGDRNRAQPAHAQNSVVRTPQREFRWPTC